MDKGLFTFEETTRPPQRVDVAEGPRVVFGAKTESFTPDLVHLGPSDVAPGSCSQLDRSGPEVYVHPDRARCVVSRLADPPATKSGESRTLGISVRGVGEGVGWGVPVTGVDFDTRGTEERREPESGREENQRKEERQ